MINFGKVFNDSLTRVLRTQDTGESFFVKFYDRFLASSPEVRDKFEHTNMEHQYRVLKLSLFHLLHCFSSSEVSDYTAEIARRHSRHDRDIPPHLYDLWLGCLLDTVKETDPQYTPDIGLAWKMVMSFGITYMKDAYERDEQLF